jgi:alkylation response protein AidB-like acyl-CoA dehydrogenase
VTGPAGLDARRAEVRAWLARHPHPTRAELAAAGYVAPHWPPPWGLGADPAHQIAIDEELAAAGVEPVGVSIGLGWAGPTIVAGGTPEQQQRFLPGILDGSDEWCQLFSEPEAGSDLASLRTRAERDGDWYVVNGQKIWSTWANRSRYGILLARTDPTVAKHEGISYFVLEMDAPGVEVRTIFEMTGGNHFNETFLTDVRIPAANRIGAEGDGWRLARVTLGNERLSLSEGGVLWGMGPTTAECFAEIRRRGGIADAVLRQRAARVHAEMVVLRLLGEQIVALAVAGGDPGPRASIRKTLADLHGQHVMSLMKDLRGAAGMLGTQDEHAEEADVWHWGYLFSRALTIGGGTTEIQRNIIGERLLGLPREPPPQGRPGTEPTP